MFKMRNALAMLTLSAAMIASLPAQADLLKITVHSDSRNVFFRNVGTAAAEDPNLRSFPAALLGIDNLNVAGSEILPAYCVEPGEFLSDAAVRGTGEEYSRGTDIAPNVQNLFDAFFYDSITSVAKSAGFQLALWELVFPDDGRVTWPQGDLAFRPENRRDRTARAALMWADHYLKNFSSFEGESLRLILWQSEDSQDVIQVLRPTDIDPVPVPGALVLLGSALAATLRFRKPRA
jgi:hypothetical protein